MRHYTLLLIQLFGSLIFCHITTAREEISIEEAEYHCGDFLNNTLNDEAMQIVYQLNNEFIRLLSRPFQHEKLFPGDTLNQEVMKQSFTERRNTWLEQEQWFLSACILLICGSALFTVFYVLYRCFSCCCGKAKKPLHTDGKYDNCKRITLQLIFSVFVIVNVFAAAVLILCSQYTTHSIETLPDRLSSCVGDLAIYKSNTQRQVDRLLTDDFNEHSQALLDAFNNTGQDIVRRFKRGISADVFDELTLQEKLAEQLKDTTVPQLKRLIKEAQNLQSVLTNGLNKMKEEYGRTLENCQPEATPACSIVSRTLSTLEVKAPALEKLEMPVEIDSLLDKTSQLNFEQDLQPVDSYFARLSDKIQKIANDKQEDAKARIQEAKDTVATVKADLDKQISNFNFNELRNGADLLKEKAEQYSPFIQYGWYASLVIAAIFSFIALCFLFGLIYGCCGKRSSYYNEDCCVRSTGSKFYCCGISLALLFMFVFAVLASGMLIIGANFNNLVCDPWKNPTERTDVVSFVDRFFFSKLLNELGAGDSANDLTLSRIITKCNEQQSFYTIFGMDKKLKLNDGFSDDLELFLNAVRIPNDFLLNESDELRNSGNSENVFKSAKTFERFNFPKIDGGSELVTESKRFDLESLDQQLRGKIASKPYASSPVANVLELFKEFAPKGKLLMSKMVELADTLKRFNDKVDQLNRKPESSKVQLAFNNLIDQNSQIRNSAFVNATEEHIVSMKKTVTAFEQHVRNAMATQITSCEPIRKILTQSHSVVCIHLMDAFNAMWTAMLVSLVLFVPMIMISTSLSRLYKNVHTYKYAIHEPNSESAFATDDYAMHEARKFSISSPYGTHNYGYQEMYPPPCYMNNSRYR